MRVLTNMYQGLEPNARSARHKVNEARDLKFLLPTK
jgi:hypothetical protein